MANKQFIYRLPRHVAKTYYELRNKTYKLQRTASSIGFINKALSNNVTPTFAKVTGNMSSEHARKKDEKVNMRIQQNEHHRTIRETIIQQQTIQEKIRAHYGYKMFKLINHLVTSSLRSENIKQLQTKNKKLFHLTKKHNNVHHVKHSIPILNLSSEDIDTTSLKKTGLDYSFIDKNKFIKREITVEMETLSNTINKNVRPEEKEILHEFLRASTNNFTHNVYQTKDKTFKSLSKLRDNDNIVLLAGDKDSSIVIIDKTEYTNNIDNMINDGIDNLKYTRTEDATLTNLHNFQQFLYRNFKTHEKYRDMRPNSNQPGRLFATAKTHKFHSYDDITIDNLKLRPIIDQTGTHTHAASKTISQYLQPLAKNDYVINNTLKFPDILKNTDLDEDFEDVSYDAESLFTSIPVNETIDFILEEIYTRKKIKPFCKKKLIFRRLLERLCFENQFSANGQLFTQIEGCTMGGSLSGTLAGIYMKKLEQDVVEPLGPTLYNRYVDDIYNRRKRNQDDILFNNLNKYHPNMKFTIEENPKFFLDTAIHKENNAISTSVYTKPNKLPVAWTSRTPKKYKKNALKTELHRAQKISSNFDNEITRIKSKFTDAGYPSRYIDAVIREFDTPIDPEEIPSWLFEDRQTVIIRLPYCESNEREATKFTTKLSKFTQDKYIFRIIWNTKKIRSLFPLKDRNIHRSCIIYEGQCTCGDLYIGETERNATTRWNEHNTPSDKSDPAKHLHDYPTHRFTWRIISSAPKLSIKRKILEHLYIAKHKPAINEQINSDILTLFKHGYT